jgi:methionyl-tRNA formyltransferase
VILFLNGGLGLDLIHSMAKHHNFAIGAIVLGHEHRGGSAYVGEIESLGVVKDNRIPVLFFSKNLYEELRGLNVLKDSVLGISALFRHVLSKEFIQAVDFPILNLHPSLLPLGRGADPIPWAIIENHDVGVTIHRIDEGIDSGNIIVQGVIPTDLSQNAGDIYSAAMQKLQLLIDEVLSGWPKSIVEVEQVGISSSHRASELANLRAGLVSDGAEIEKAVRIIQALTYNDGTGAKIKATDGKIWSIQVIATEIKDD